MLHMDNSGTWSLGVLIGVPVLILILLFIIATAVLGAMFGDDMAPPAVHIAGGVIAVIITLGIALSPLGFYPFSGEYHQWRNVSGTVAKIDKRLISSGSSSMEDKFVIRFQGSPMQFGCDDTRCAQVSEGDSLTLSCKRAWQYTGTDGYDCRFVSTEAAS